MEGDRERWNAKWRERAGELETHAHFLVEHAQHLPTQGKALDIAGGAGRNAIWLARRGLDVTLVDVSDVALHKAELRAKNAGLDGQMRFLRLDLDRKLDLAPLFDLVLVSHYLNRARRDEYVALLHEGGTLVAVQPTVTNLERHPKPGPEYLVEPGELAEWATRLGLAVLAAREEWNVEGRHEALVIAKRTPGLVIEEVDREDTGPQLGPYR